MIERTADAKWEGNLKDGRGRVALGSGAFDGDYSAASRFADGSGTNPEELIGAALAGCFSMALANDLAEAGHTPDWIRTQARVRLVRAGGGFEVADIMLTCSASVNGLSAEAFAARAAQAKRSCPISRALAGTEITLKAQLVDDSGGVVAQR